MDDSLQIRIRFFRDLPAHVEKPIQNDACIVPKHLWTRWINEQITEVLLLKINLNETSHIFTVDSSHNQPRNIIYIPDHYSTEFDIELIYDAELLDCLPPIATQITLQILESDFAGIDIASAASEYLSKCNILKRHTILQIPFPELGDLVLDVFVADTAPQEFVLLRGEVPLEIANSEQAPFPEPVHFPQLTPTPMSTPTLSPAIIDSFDNVLPEIHTPEISGFKAFCGKGYRLGS
jgi:hypothetical protein